MPRISVFYGIAIYMYFRDHGRRISTRSTQARRQWLPSRTGA
jgi:hypothetical protein